VAQHIRRRALAKAMLVKAGGLDSIREGIQQRVATEIIEWEMGKAEQLTKTDITTGGDKIIFQVGGTIDLDKDI